MQAITYTRYGGPEVLSLADIEEPVPGPGEVLVEVRAASANPYDFHFMRGEPLFMRLMVGLRRPKRTGLGRDVAGIVVAVGPDTDWSVGDEVFGAGFKTFAERCIAKASELARKPKALSFEEAAALPMVCMTGLQGLQQAGVRAGHRVLVNGASGGIGHTTVQMAKAMGAHVTAVCKTSNVDWVHALGADAVIDYTTDSMLHHGPFDVIIDPIANHPVKRVLDILAPGGAYVLLGYHKMGLVLGPIPQVLQARMGRKRGRRVLVLDATYDRACFEAIAAFADAGQLRPVIEQTLSLADVGDAISHVEAGHSRGKTVIVP